MKQMKCELCGSTDFVKEDGVFVCQYCGAKYSVEEAKKMMIEGTVDVSGSTVKVDAEADIANWYTIARRAKNSGDSKKAEQYYDMILQKKPEDWEATFYTSYFAAAGATYGSMRNALINLTNTIPSVFDIISDINDKEEEKAAVKEIGNACMDLCSSVTTAMVQTYKENIGSPDNRSMVSGNAHAAIDLVDLVSRIVESNYGDDCKELYKNLIITAMESSINCGTWMNYNGAIMKPFREKANRYKERLSVIDGSAEEIFKQKQQASSGCYVATAVYGSYDCPEVWTLRRFRDYELAETWYGRAFIHTYYAISPTLVELFGHTDWFKRMWKGKLDRMVKDLQSKGYESTPYEDRNW